MQYKNGKGPTRYQFLRGLIRAIKKGQQQQDSQLEHQGAEEVRQTTEAGGRHRTGQGRQKQT
jgi:hypothetical protein